MEIAHEQSSSEVKAVILQIAPNVSRGLVSLPESEVQHGFKRMRLCMRYASSLPKLGKQPTKHEPYTTRLQAVAFQIAPHMQCACYTAAPASTYRAACNN
eukprot:1139318-Pelagomonas_calceolata.AAC.2